MQSTINTGRRGQVPGLSSNNPMDGGEQLTSNIFTPGIVPQALFQPSILPSESNKTVSSRKVHDELYDVSDEEDSDAEVVPFRISNSIKRAMGEPAANNPRRRPSIMIPPPSSWPNVAKIQKDGEITPLAHPKSPLSPAALAKLAIIHNDPLPNRSATPSLADSATSADEGSCISTPDIGNREDDERGLWSAPIRLNPLALNALNHIRTDLDVVMEEERATVEHTIHIPEMQDRGLAMNSLFATSPGSDDREPMSAISLPSPGGFASLASTMNIFGFRTPHSSAPNTSTAENFYGVPWRDPPQQTLETIEDADEDIETSASSTPPATDQQTLWASMIPASSGVDGSQEMTRVAESTAADEAEAQYDVEYADKLQKEAATNMRRTSIWLSAQETYLSAFKDCIGTVPSVPTDDQNINLAASPVQDADSPSSVYPPRSSSLSSDHGSLFDDAFQHLLNTTSSQDAFIQRRARADAVQAQRLYLPDKHVAQLSGKFSIQKHPVKSQHWLDAATKSEEQDAEDRRAELARANIEQQVLQQISITFWEQEATRFLMGGFLIHKAAARQLRKQARLRSPTQILDLGGQATAGWGWLAAHKCPDSKVVTAITASNAQGTCSEANIQSGPSNHSTVTVPNPWTLPFPDNSFTLVSTGSLHALLRTSKPSRAPEINDGILKEDRVCPEEQRDEYEATLAEIYRVLAPGGFIQFQILDAEITGNPRSTLVSKSVEFAVALRSLSYDPSASTHFVERLQKAGFDDVNRTWMKLPLGSSKPKTKDPNAVTTVVSTPTMEESNESILTAESSELRSIDSRIRSPEPDGKRRLAWSKGNVLQKITKSPRKRPPPIRSLPPVSLPDIPGRSPPMSHSSPLASPKPSLQSTITETLDTEEVEDVGIESLTGMLGSLSWERWMLRLQTELGKSELQLLEGVAQALEDARTSGTSAAWTMLIGCAMKKA